MLSVVLALAVDMVMFAILFSRLSGAQPVVAAACAPARSSRPWASSCSSSSGRSSSGVTTQNPLYATFGVMVGLLVWINFASKLLIFVGGLDRDGALLVATGGGRGLGAGRTTGIAWATEPVAAVAPGDYEAVPVEADDVAGGSSSRRSWRAVALGAGIGAAAAAVVTRRRSARSRG